MKVLVISASARCGGNSDSLAHSFKAGAVNAGHDVEVVTLSDKNIAFCKGCFGCQKTCECVIKDDAPAITRKMHDADVICFAAPVYYYSIPGQLKTLLDRSNGLYTSDYKFRKIYTIFCATENDAHTPLGAIIAIQGWVECFPRARLVGNYFVGGVTDVCDIKKSENTALLDGAKKLGESIK